MKPWEGANLPQLGHQPCWILGLDWTVQRLLVSCMVVLWMVVLWMSLGAEMERSIFQRIHILVVITCLVWT